MFEVKAKLTQEEFEKVEILIFESEGVEHWNLYEDFEDKSYWAQGIFENESEAKAGKEFFAALLELGGDRLSVAKLEDKDWKESYKEHFQPWSIGPLHWAPVWLQEEYELPKGHEAVWLDPGMAFGTGNHGTTRLCVEELIAFKESGGDPKTARVVDAGCGSGILSISAARLGYERVAGFDIDEDAVRIARENAALNGVPEVRFFAGGLEEGLKPGEADCVLANILANVLMANARLLIDAVAPGGWLILSGILGTEAEAVKAHFESMGDLAGGEIVQMDEWASVTFVKG